MKKHLLFAILFICNFSFANGPFTNSTSGINANDTVVFDITKITLAGNSLQFPISILSDDTIYSLDFSMKYNCNTLSYDSIIDHTNYLQAFSFYNTTDSTLRFTSNSMHSYTNDTALVSISFTSLSGIITGSDVINPKAYLNGMPCTVKIVTSGTTALEEITANDFQIFPNPASDYLYLNLKTPINNIELSINDLSGKIILQRENSLSAINISDLSPGIYFLNLKSNNSIISKKFIKL